METQPNNNIIHDYQTHCEHPIGQLVLQTLDMPEHNRGVRCLLDAASIKLIGSKVIAFCPDCGGDLHLPTQALTIDPLV